MNPPVLNYRPHAFIIVKKSDTVLSSVHPNVKCLTTELIGGKNFLHMDFNLRNVKKTCPRHKCFLGLPPSSTRLKAHMSNLKAVGKGTCAPCYFTKCFLCTDMANTCCVVFIITVKRCWDDFTSIRHFQAIVRINSEPNPLASPLAPASG